MLFVRCRWPVLIVGIIFVVLLAFSEIRAQNETSAGDTNTMALKLTKILKNATISKELVSQVSIECSLLCLNFVQ
jgi:hypothetical protein